MPLSTCPDCGREVSTRARHCVHCGRPWPAARCGGAWALLIGLLTVGLVLGGGVMVAKKQCRKAREARHKAEAVQRIAVPAPAPAPVEPAKAAKEEE